MSIPQCTTDFITAKNEGVPHPYDLLCNCDVCYQHNQSVSDTFSISLRQLGINPLRYAASLNRLDVLDTLAEEGNESAITEFEALCDQLTQLCKDLDPSNLQYGIGGS